MKLTTVSAAALLLVGSVSAESDSSKAAALEKFWSYGRSEPVYPTRKLFAPTFREYYLQRKL